MLIDLVRHGATQAIGVLLGRTDVDPGEGALELLQRQVAGLPIDGVVSSPLARSRIPAAALARMGGLPIAVDADWMEIDFGAWDGGRLPVLNSDPASAAQLAAFYGSADAAAPPGGESWGTLAVRVQRAIDRLIASHDETSRVLVVTHAGPMRAALALTCAIPFVNLWAFRIGFGTRVTLQVGRDGDGKLWGEIVEVVQP